MPLGFAVAQIGSLAVFDRQGALLEELGPGEAVVLQSGAERAIDSTGSEPTRYLQIALIATDLVPQSLPADIRASEPFTVLAGAIAIDLSQGSLDGSGALSLPAGAYPALLLVTDDIVAVRETDGETRVLGTGESALLDTTAQVWVAGQHPATFVVARVSPATLEREGYLPGPQEQPIATRQRLDPALDVVWERNGCPLNPGNPPCLTITQAATCTIDPGAATCGADSDGDGCLDIAEARLGLDPFDAADCFPNPTGQPAVNCLFPIANRTCGRPDGQEEDKSVADS
jgi:hypothetical protein